MLPIQQTTTMKLTKEDRQTILDAYCFMLWSGQSGITAANVDRVTQYSLLIRGLNTLGLTALDAERKAYINKLKSAVFQQSDAAHLLNANGRCPTHIWDEWLTRLQSKQYSLDQVNELAVDDGGK